MTTSAHLSKSQSKTRKWYSKLLTFRKNKGLWEFLETITETFRKFSGYIWYFKINLVFYESKNRRSEIYRAFIPFLPARRINKLNQNFNQS